jgi:hypothetical protein
MQQRHHQYRTELSPVEAIIELRKEMEEFLRASYPQTYKEKARAALRKVLLLVAACSSRPTSETVVGESDAGLSPAPSPDGFSVIDHLKDRGVIGTWSKRQLARRRRDLLARSSEASTTDSTPSPSPSPSADPAEIQPPTSDGGAL